MLNYQRVINHDIDPDEMFVMTFTMKITMTTEKNRLTLGCRTECSMCFA